MGGKIFFKYLGLFLFGTAIFLVYQNCSRTANFQSIPETEQSSSSADEPTNSVVDTGTFTKSIKPFVPLSDQIDVVLIIDDSKSNAGNANQVVQGIKGLFNRLTEFKDQTVTVMAYSMRATGANGKSTSVFKDASGRIEPNAQPNTYLRISEYAYGRPIVKFDISSQQTSSAIETEINKAVSEIQSYLADSSNTTTADTTPSPYCDIVAYLSQNKISTVRKSTAFVLVTDEDSDVSAPSRQCYKHWDIVYLKGGGGTPYVMVPVKKTVKAESGGNIDVFETLSITSISSCSQTSEILNFVTSRGFSTVDNTISGCRVYGNNEGADKQIDVTYYSWMEEPYKSSATASNLNISTQLKRAMELPKQGPIFIGVFSLQANDTIKNPDQEIAKTINAWVPSVLPTGQYQLQSLLQPNYGSFLDQVLNFKLNASVNLVSIADLIAKIPAGKSLRIREVYFSSAQSSSKTKIESFLRQGSDLLVNDTTVKLADGGELNIVYSFE